MAENSSIIVENVSKVYKLLHPKINEKANLTNEHWALRNISFEIKKGESVGIIGPNGSGKSTLLKILAGVTKPTHGKAMILGKVGSILDIGAGFHPELSGSENIFLNGQIHGFSKSEIKSKYDAIVNFSGVEKFINEPVKNYSNGMYLRLAFSIMANLDFDVFLFDEVFSVGDAEFNIKTRAKFQELRATKKTIVFVSHNLNELENQDKYILLENGFLKEVSQKRNILSNYLEDVFHTKNMNICTEAISIEDFSKFDLSNELRVVRLSFFQREKTKFTTDAEFELELEIEKLLNTDSIDPVLVISEINGNILLSSSPFLSGKFARKEDAANMVYRCKIPKNFFGSQVYNVSLCFMKNLYEVENYITETVVKSADFTKNTKTEVVLFMENIITFKPNFANSNMNIDLSNLNLHGSLLPAFDWTCE